MQFKMFALYEAIFTFAARKSFSVLLYEAGGLTQFFKISFGNKIKVITFALPIAMRG